MAQTGIPFGQVGMSRDFLRVDGPVRKPAREHPKRPVDGFNCKRNEVSGERFWTFFANICKSPENFAKNCLVYNHCPLVSIPIQYKIKPKNNFSQNPPKYPKQELIVFFLCVIASLHLTSWPAAWVTFNVDSSNWPYFLLQSIFLNSNTDERTLKYNLI